MSRRQPHRARSNVLRKKEQQLDWMLTHNDDGSLTEPIERMRQSIDRYARSIVERRERAAAGRPLHVFDTDPPSLRALLDAAPSPEEPKP